jgi:(1->4)-alpha-D-glucan 1-alpha-D-glucosylmutase
MTPRATMRLQFHKGFTFDDAATVVPYLAALGVSHLYASPIMAARAGSQHGYDVIDPTRVNPELGGEDGLMRLSRALRDRNMGLIIDIVPNHMAAGSDNAWWMDVLARGRDSRYARFFDIDWQPAERSLRNKVLVPILGQPYGDALDAGEIKLGRDPKGEATIHYFEHVLPLSPCDRSTLAGGALEAFDSATQAGRERLHELLQRQNYRLAWWRTANDTINWRRFFDINDLIALRMEDDETFEAVHETAFRLYRDGIIDGLRIDHVDGLSKPQEYCVKLRKRLDTLSAAGRERGTIVVEKILAHDERLPESWQTDGTTGYDFMDQVSAVLHDGSGEQPLSALWHRVSGRSADFAVEEELCRRQILGQSFASQLAATVGDLDGLGQDNIHTRDITRAAIRRVLTEILVHFPVYRIYAEIGHASESDRYYLECALARARTTCLPGDRHLLGLVGEWLLGRRADRENCRVLSRAMTRLQQLSAPLSAKAVEDTAFYRFGRLLSRNDVGFDPRRFAGSIAEFHQDAAARHRCFPKALLATATHDHKRGEDVRARLAVLSEIPQEWEDRLQHWLAAADALPSRRDARPVAGAGDLAILFQTLVGAWPINLRCGDSGLADFEERIANWQQKAMREAKLVSDWSEPNEQYERSAREFVAGLFRKRELLSDIEAFVHRVAPAGVANSLAQLLLKLTMPGVPDIYQGTDFWDFSLVDPDNRRPVDFGAREEALTSTPPAELSGDWADGRLKQAVTARALAVRSSQPALFAHGDYLPIAAEGPRREHLIAFARQHKGIAAIVVVCRWPTRLLAPGTIAISPEVWAGTRLLRPEALQGASLVNVLDPSTTASVGAVELGATFARLPVALLMSHA